MIPVTFPTSHARVQLVNTNAHQNGCWLGPPHSPGRPRRCLASRTSAHGRKQTFGFAGTASWHSYVSWNSSCPTDSPLLHQCGVVDGSRADVTDTCDIRELLEKMPWHRISSRWLAPFYRPHSTSGNMIFTSGNMVLDR